MRNNIRAGEELTRRYGTRKWILWILLDIFGINPLSDMIFTYPKNYTDIQKDMVDAANNFNRVAIDIGHGEFVEHIALTVKQSGFTDKLDLYDKIMAATDEYMRNN